ncbi:unnamed protein product, partial [marine sediment metagenome]
MFYSFLAGGSVAGIYFGAPAIADTIGIATGIVRGVGIVASLSMVIFYVIAGFALYDSYKNYEILIADHLTIPFNPFPDIIDEDGAGIIKLITDRPGAEISIWQDGEWKSTLVKTPQTLLLSPIEYKFRFYLMDFKLDEWEGEETFTIVKESVLEPEVIQLTKVVPVRPPLPESLTATVVGHIDGDTIRVRIAEPPVGIPDVFDVRFLGINTPEGPRYVYSCTELDEPFLVRRLLTPGEECLSEETWHVGNYLYEIVNS